MIAAWPGMISAWPGSVRSTRCLSRLCRATRSLFEAVLNQRSLASGGGEQQPCGDLVEAAVTWPDAVQRLLLFVGEVPGGGPDRALLPALAVQPRARRLQAFLEDVECPPRAFDFPFEHVRELGDGDDAGHALKCRFDGAVVGAGSTASWAL